MTLWTMPRNSCLMFYMEHSLSFSIPVKAIPKGRPRLSRFGRAFTPKKTQDFEEIIRDHSRAIMNDLDVIDTMISVSVSFTFKQPNKPSRAYPSKGDLDNFLKAVLDGMNGIVFFDDVQITHIEASKKYGEFDLIDIKIFWIG